MRRLLIALAVAGSLTAMPGVALAGQADAPSAACNTGTMNAHMSVPEATGNGSPIEAHEHIPEGEGAECVHEAFD